MNMSRGLFRAWVALSILWIVGAGITTYFWSETLHGSYQPAGKTKGDVKPWDIDYKKPFYETMISPSAEKLSVTFFSVAWQYKSDWDNDATMAKHDMPDGSRLYMRAAYNEADQNYIVEQFWDQRWSRYGHAATIIALWALVPCIALFMFGYTLLWIGRGFKRS